MESRGTNDSVWKHIDWFTVAIYLVMIIAGVFSVYAACYNFGDVSIFDGAEYSGKQIRWVTLALVLALVLLLFDSRVYETYAYPIYLIVLVIMLITLFVAPEIKGSRSWLVMGPLRFQPAEFGKFATALALAKLFSTYNFKLGSMKSYARALAIIIVPIVLIIAQKETGSALAYTALFLVLYREGMSGLVLLGAGCAVLFFVCVVKFADLMVMGIPLGHAIVFIVVMVLMVCMTVAFGRRFDVARNLLLWFVGTALLCALLHLFGVEVGGYVFFIGSILVAAVYCLALTVATGVKRLALPAATALASIIFLFSVNIVFNSVLKPYQRERIQETLGVVDDPLGIGYNVNQAKIAIGSGGITGKGFLNGTQTKLKYVPEQHTDFIFCTIGEEQGFLGTSAVLLLFLVLILRVIHIAERQPSTFARVYGYSVASYFIFHLVINIGMVIGLTPVIGVPLPFFSYGGSSLWSFTILLFILLRLDAARRYHPSYL